MKPGKIIIISFLMCLVTGFTVSYLGDSKQKKIGFADAVKLFDGFNMKKELEAKEKVKLESLSKQLDSVKNQLQLAHAEKNDEYEKNLTHSYNYLAANLENEYKQGSQEMDRQVWKRLNPLVEQYGKEHQLHLLIGANGMGSVLYADEYFDLTSDLINYVNKKYEGGN